MSLTNDQREKIVGIVDRCAVFFFAVLIFFLPISNAVIESCFGFIYLCFIARCIFKRPTKKEIKAFFTNRINLSLLIFYLAAALSMLVSGPLIAKSFHAWFFKWGEGVLLFYFAQVFIKKEQVKPLLIVFLASCFLVSVDGIYQKIVGYDFIRNFRLFNINSSAPRATFAHYNDFAAYLAVMLFVAFGLLSSFKKILPRLILASVAILMLTNLFFTYSRGAWLSFILVSTFLTLSFIGRKAKTIVFCFLVIFILLAFSSPFARERLSYTFNKGGDANRFNMWKVAFLMFKDSPLLGQGIGQFMDHINDPAYFERMGGVMFQHGQYTHNCYLQMLAEMGLLGLLSFLWFAGETLSRSYRIIVRNRDFLFAGIFCSLLVFLIHSFFDTQFYSLKLSTLFWIIVSFLGVYVAKESPKAIIGD